MATSSQEFGGESHPRAGYGHCRVRLVMPNHPDCEGENDVSNDRSSWEYEERDGFENKTNGSDHLGLFQLVFPVRQETTLSNISDIHR